MPVTDRYAGVTDEGRSLQPKGPSAAVLPVLCRNSGEIREDPLLDAVVVVGVPFGHTRPQWILPYGGTVTVDRTEQRVWADYS